MPKENTVFDRLGGLGRLEYLVDGFYDLMATDKDMGRFFHMRNLANLKKRTVDFLGGMWGGDAYRGPDLFLAHTGLGITLRIFDLMMKCLVIHLKVMKCDKDLTKIILKDIEEMREPICDPSGKLAKARNAKNLEDGDPFDDEANRQACAELQRKEAERKAKMAAFKKAKAEKEKLEKEKAELVKQRREAKPKEAKAATPKLKTMGGAGGLPDSNTSTMESLTMLPSFEEEPQSEPTPNSPLSSPCFRLQHVELQPEPMPSTPMAIQLVELQRFELQFEPMASLLVKPRGTSIVVSL
ncbi:unnamed protein product [Polarella glacialis]|uniref:Uncharacterized protein n=1 Tax=Polarella glacialis TaxID=89957 RepID=A0A813HQ03_POLGL|nr:unnamed protein product [Polarella glacialis]